MNFDWKWVVGTTIGLAAVGIGIIEFEIYPGPDKADLNSGRDFKNDTHQIYVKNDGDMDAIITDVEYFIDNRRLYVSEREAKNYIAAAFEMPTDRSIFSGTILTERERINEDEEVSVFHLSRYSSLSNKVQERMSCLAEWIQIKLYYSSIESNEVMEGWYRVDSPERSKEYCRISEILRSLRDVPT